MYKGSLGVVDDLFKVKKFVRKYLKPEEKPADKSKDRVITSLARSIRRTTPLPKGPCQFCETMSEKLVPIPINLCTTCTNRFIKKSDNLRFLKWEWCDFYCDWCLGKSFKKFSVNPWLDKKCMDRLGRKHMSNRSSLNARIQSKTRQSL